MDELVRLKPKAVRISSCRTTPAAKVIQFNTELRARHDVEVTGVLIDPCPAS